ncbi:MAG: UDP-N-acetylmuramate dehydrogenase [Rickettsiales bacterium]|nr:UDP-N-acetylmuramate dehydrogenase [Rickettsiales bacterium]
MVSTLESLPKVRGVYQENAPLANHSWFRVGGVADILFTPTDVHDLSKFLSSKPLSIETTILGACSNVIIRDKGISGCVIKLNQNFTNLVIDGCIVKVGCGVFNNQLVSYLLNHGLTGLEFLSSIPGCIGGAIAMNAGCYGHEISDFLIEVEAVEKSTGKIYQIPAKSLSLGYRKNDLAESFIFTKATFLLQFEKNQDKIKEYVNEISKMKSLSQPTRERTGGSSFKNPDVKHSKYKAWELIDKAGLRGFVLGGAKVSEKHANFLINTGQATAENLEKLGEIIRDKVKEKFDVDLEWEIKRIGRL